MENYLEEETKMIDVLVLEKAVNAIKTLVTLAICLNSLILVIGFANYIQGGKFNANID